MFSLKIFHTQLAPSAKARSIARLLHIHTVVKKLSQTSLFVIHTYTRNVRTIISPTAFSFYFCIKHEEQT